MAADKPSLEKQLEDYRFALSKVSHEVRNPVTLINSYLQLLEKDHPELKQNELWSDITEEMLFLRRLLDDLSLLQQHLSLSVQCYGNVSVPLKIIRVCISAFSGFPDFLSDFCSGKFADTFG